MALALGPARVVSHGFLVLLILSVIFYLGLSARSGASTPGRSEVTETTYAFYSDGYLLRPAARLRSVSPQPAPRPEAVQSEGPRETPTAPAPERTEPVTYEVAPGDTLSTIAERFGITTETLLWANNIRNADLIRLGQELLILPVSGILHVVQKGDTLLGLASRYGVDAEDILAYKRNGLSDADSLGIGQKLVVPGGAMPAARPAPSSRGGVRQAEAVPVAPAQAQPAAGRFAWPTWGPIFQYFYAGHSGLDISPPYGTPVRAADGGVVVRAERLNWGLGWYLEVDHGNGYSTVYAHLSRFEVWIGDQVAQGEVVGLVGTTGYVTGPHLHFEVHRNGVPVNPLNVLP